MCGHSEEENYLKCLNEKIQLLAFLGFIQISEFSLS